MERMGKTRSEASEDNGPKTGGGCNWLGEILDLNSNGALVETEEDVNASGFLFDLPSDEFIENICMGLFFSMDWQRQIKRNQQIHTYKYVSTASSELRRCATANWDALQGRWRGS